MKDIIALLVFVCLVTITIYLAVTKQISWKIVTVLLFFSISAPFVIVKYDEIKKFKLSKDGLELELAKKQLNLYKEKALDEIDKEVKEQKQSIKLLISNANDMTDKAEEQSNVLNKLIGTATRLQGQIEEQAEIAKALQDKTDVARADIRELNMASEKIALLLIKATYLTLETKNEFGGQRSKKAVEEIVNGLNQVLPLVIKDERETL